MSEEKQKRVILTVGGESLDLTDYPALTQGDKKALKKEPYSLDMRNMKDWDENQESMFALYLLKRVRSNTTLDEVDRLPVLFIQQLANHCLVKSAEVDSPFSKPSTNSQKPTDGARANSPATVAPS